jgi:glutathione S-transferase
MKLVIATPSPYARKVRIALHEKGIAFEEIVDIPWNPGTVAPSLNPLGKIPVLILGDGRAIYDSRVIVEYLDTLDRPPQLIPSDPKQRIAVKQVEALADGICDAVVLIAIEARRKPELQSRDWVARQRAKVEAGTAALNDHIGTRSWAVDSTFSLADITAATALAYLDLRLPGYSWRESFPHLVAYEARLAERPSFKRSRPAAQSIVEIG